MEAQGSLADTRERFVRAILSVVGHRVSAGDITGETRLIEDLSMSSIELLKLMLACEKEVGVSPADDDDLADTLSTVGRAVTALHALRQAKTSAAA